MAVRVLWVIKGLGPGGAERLLVNLATAHDASVATFECAYVVPEKDHLVAEMEAAGVPCECVSHRARDPWWPLRLSREQFLKVVALAVLCSGAFLIYRYAAG